MREYAGAWKAVANKPSAAFDSYNSDLMPVCITSPRLEFTESMILQVDSNGDLGPLGLLHTDHGQTVKMSICCTIEFIYQYF